MQIFLRSDAACSAELFMLPIAEKGKKPLLSLSQKIDTKCTDLIKKKRVSGKSGEQAIFYPDNEKFEAVYLFGIGALKEFSAQKARSTAASLYHDAEDHNFASVALAIPAVKEKEQKAVLRAVVDGFLSASYRFDSYKGTKEQEKKKQPVKKLTIVLAGLSGSKLKELKITMSLQQKICCGVFAARDLANTPSSDLTPPLLADKAVEMCKKEGIKVSVFDKKKIKSMNMGCLSAVGRGSSSEPRLIIMEHGKEFKNEKNDTVAIVGKGITFDSGGISLKPGAGMDEMKMDMSGAAAVFGIMQTIAQIGLKRHVIGIITSAENMPSGAAYKPGDILTARNGKTIEVLNTDAEGRLILSDALCYAAEQKPKVIIDLATLTGACLVALGTTVAALISNNDTLVKEMKEASKSSGEQLWQLPSYDEFREQIKSDIADLKNVGGRNAGTITAGLFLEEFVDDTPWAHIDIAGTAMQPKPTPLCSTKGSGFGVKLVVEYLQRKA